MNDNSLITQAYHLLNERYGDLNWWPADTPYEMMLGAILTQNTSWANVEKSIANLKNCGALNPQAVLAMDKETLSQLIRPSGLFNQKSGYIISLTQWYISHSYGLSMETLRRQLLALKGIGPETADCILLYAFGLPSFVIDSYTMRLCKRLGLAIEGYSAHKAFFESHLPIDVSIYNQYHALIVQNAKEYCKKKPICLGQPLDCPLVSVCYLHASKTKNYSAEQYSF